MASIKKAAQNKALDTVLANLGKTYGKGFLRKGSDLEIVDTFKTGHDDLDSVLVKDGFGMARGKIIELYGPESGGKSSLALRVCGYAQKEGYYPMWFDLERALVKGGIAEINGVDMDNIIIPELIDTEATEQSDSSSPYDAGTVLDMMEAAIKSGQFNPVVLDSVAALTPEQEMNAESFNKDHMMLAGRLMSKALRKINAWAAEKNVCVIFVNQERDKPSLMGATVTTPGGRALKFYASQRIRITKITGGPGEIKELDEDGRQELIGHWARVKIVKNRCAPPYNDPIEIPIYYKQHFPDNAERLFQLARDLKIISVRKGVFTWKSGEEVVVLVDGTSKVLNKIREDGLESRLSYECLEAEKSEKNQNKKIPTKVPASLAALAKDYKEKNDSISV